MARIWDARDIEGYTRLLDAFVDGALRPGTLSATAFSMACIRLWTADRDLCIASTDPARTKTAEHLLHSAITARTSAEEFGSAWAALWACGHRRPPPHGQVLDLIHHWAVHYTPDRQLRNEDPHMSIDEWRLWDVMMALRAVLRCLTEEDWPIGADEATG